MPDSSVAPVIVMGVQGSGKSTIGALLAEALSVPFIDGDDLHTPQAKAKMASGFPLDDSDREPWLRTIAHTIAEHQVQGNNIVVACSALKKKYRDAMRSIVPELTFVHLNGVQDLIAQRLSHREHEYMPTTLLDSQYGTLEPLSPQEQGFVVDVTDGPDDVVRLITSQLGQR